MDSLASLGFAYVGDLWGALNLGRLYHAEGSRPPCLIQASTNPPCLCKTASTSSGLKITSQAQEPNRPSALTAAISEKARLGARRRRSNALKKIIATTGREQKGYMAERYEMMSLLIYFDVMGRFNPKDQKTLNDLGAQGWEIKAVLPFSISGNKCNVLLQRVIR